MSLRFSFSLRMSNTRCVLRASLALTFLVLFASFAAAQSGQNFVLAWNPSTDPTVVGYVVYFGTSSGVYTNRVDVGTNTAYTVTNLQPGIAYYFAVSDYNSLGTESEPSAPFQFVVPGLVKLVPNKFPGGVMLVYFPVVPPYSYEIQASVDLKNWVTIGTTGVVTNNMWMACADFEGSKMAHRFYRSVAH